MGLLVTAPDLVGLEAFAGIDSCAANARENGTAAAAKPSAALHNHLGSVLVKLGKTDEAVTQFQGALAIDAGNAEAMQNLSAIERKKKRGNQ